MIPDTASLLLAWDLTRPRTQQAEIGMSDLGSCRRKVGYQLAGYPVHDPKGSVQAVLGTAVHDAVGSVLRAMRARGEIPADALIEEEVRFGGVKGHLDLFVEPTIRDTKTLGYKTQLERFQVVGPPRAHRWQVNCYGAALAFAGKRVETVQLDYISRDCGETWLWEEPFDVGLVREAFEWLRDVRETELDFLARDYAPASAQCQSCPFFDPCWGGGVPDRDPRSVLYIEDADAAKWYDRLEDARARAKQAREDEAEARGALDALRPNTKGRGEVALPGKPKVLRWTVSPNMRTDTRAMRQDYERAGHSPPVVIGEPTVKLSLVAPPKPKRKKKGTETE